MAEWVDQRSAFCCIQYGALWHRLGSSDPLFLVPAVSSGLILVPTSHNHSARPLGIMSMMADICHRDRSA